ncbi:ABC transporter permease [Pyrococcus kukulkanii]|uniref:ABC transporter permease n=1 Tax=Pyrococcus kukulkanii TaxID=1609559 RepID=A0A127BD03_9EURY|nr:ABC transporter permease [Pyrococcus kukulkanii]AMM54689.1 ABC transporter permease [Pyrococcus kukulkanii]
MKWLKVLTWESSDPLRGYVLVLTIGIVAIFLKISLIKGVSFILMSKPKVLLQYSIFTMFSFKAYIACSLGISFLVSLAIRGERDEGGVYFTYSLPYNPRLIFLAKIASAYILSLTTLTVVHALLFFSHFSSEPRIASITVLRSLPTLVIFYAIVLLYIVALSSISASLLPNASTAGILSFFLIFGISDNIREFNPVLTLHDVFIKSNYRALLPYFLVSIVLIPLSIEIMSRRDIR